MHLSVTKLVRSKWTACVPRNKEKHFLVIALVQPETPEAPIEQVTMEAVYSGRRFEMAWRALYDQACWHQGWLRQKE